MKLNTEHNVKMALFQQDLVATMQSKNAWQIFIDDLVKSDPDGESCAYFEKTYRALAADGDTNALYEQLCSDQLDNYIMGTFAACRMGIPKDTPLVAWAAENKRLYKGLHGEIANLRTLLIMGFNPNVTYAMNGNTAMHKMCRLNWGEGVHVRAIKVLLESGANPNIPNVIGDTPFCYLCGSYPFTDHVQEALLMMLAAGADPSIKAEDGADALHVLKSTEKFEPDPARLALIKKIENDLAVRETQNASK